ncbi:hypothetical protein [Streptomyces sp. Ru72]|uniref:hypothetical protein n=1 Tax=Streptomyces sp. Ru72 TaxID=2080747 RepID=UPI0011B03C70|nr:hypothetical protein [Streptomyces sp. Ru72]
MRHRRTGVSALTVAALIVPAAACASGTGATEPAKRSPSASDSVRPSATAGSSTRLCLSGTVTVRYPPADNPLHSACVHVGTAIRITLKPTANYRWAPVTSSQAKTVTVLDDHPAPGGTRCATARDATAGTATLTSAYTYTPDPHGPPSRAWRLTLTVVP